MLPRLAVVVPMEAKLRQNTRDAGWLLFRELNPAPLADDFDKREELRGFAFEQFQQMLRIE
jgi:hypothetical protein